MNTRRFAYVIVIGLTGSCSSAIAVEDAKVYPGAMCKPSSASGDFLIGGDGSFFSQDTTLDIFCPVATDSIGTLNDIELANIVVQPSDDEVYPSCTLITTDGVDNARPTRTAPSSFEDLDDDTRKLRFGDGGANIPTAYAGTAFFLCRLPESASVVSYSITENVKEN